MPFQSRMSLANAVDYRAIPDGMELEGKRLALSQLGQQVDLREEQKMLAERKRVASEKLGALVSQNPKATDQEIYAAGGVELGNEFLKSRAAQIKEDNANNTAQFELLAKKAKAKADLFATAKDQPSYENAIRLSLENGWTTEDEARQALSVPFSPEIAAALQQQAQSFLGFAGMLDAEIKQAAEARAQAAEQRAQAGEQRNAEKFTIEKPGMVADARLKVDTAAGQAPMQPKDRAAIEDAEKDRKLREREGALNRGVTMTVAKMTDARQRDANSVAAKPLSAEAAKVVSVASTVRPEIEKLKQAFRTDYKGSVRGIVTGSNRELTRLADNIADKVGRLRSGGAINKEESDRFMRQIAHWRDMLSNDPKAAETAIAALDGLLSETDSVINSMKPQGGTQKPADPLGIR